MSWRVHSFSGGQISPHFQPWTHRVGSFRACGGGFKLHELSKLAKQLKAQA